MTQHQSSAPEPSVNGRGSVMPFDLGGHPMRFGMTSAGRVWVAATDFAKALGYRTAGDALRNVDVDEKGTQIVRTPGGDQQLSVLYEEGIWELIFISRRAEAKTLKCKVKEVLRKIRETGRYEAPDAGAGLPQDYEEALVHLLGKVRENKALAAENKVLAPKASKWDQFMNTEDLIGMTAIADLLGTDVCTMTGWLVKKNIFRKQVSTFGSRRNMPRRMYQESGFFAVKMETNGKVSYEVAYATKKGADLVFDAWQQRAAA